MGVVINHSVINKIQEEGKNNLAKNMLLKELASLRLENKEKDLIAKNLMQQLAEIRLNLIEKEGN
ncbi:hypothetical protein FDC45_15605 [Clostridium botulinum]|uniref:Uncharacterized protein n=1 Tax=Clostridium botulinum TaxID=1491 RepID=A0A846J449_CLOBO|nr:hypothetical protein [Clostridium botulinum]ACA56944.1 hypothetical protein CLK_1317 [Clostridium botulinum A3 str. Loch Maree]NFH66124.1 hypothetical protein [Clostridium botulinum]NFJ08729.1 hypothetical protein [Clostridium botulinum]NFK15125.1 hypothetical protein [Clostridium botulinum]NFM93085.1 hypothetical protein [Clostridium botulinum]